MSEVRGLGLIPSPIDKRDILMSSILPEFSIPRQFVVENITPVRDQGPDGTCVGFACAVGMKESQEQKEHNKYIELSPRYLYQKCKEIDGIPEANGTYIRVAMEILYHIGVCEEIFWPYHPTQIGRPMPGADENAKNYKVKSYCNMGKSLDTMKRSLVVNGPFVIGVTVYDNWRNPEVGKTGKIPLPSGNILGGHALCVVGYDDDTQMFKFKNSWGDKWGDRGFGYLPYPYTEADTYFEAYGATDLIDDVEALVKAKEKVLQQMGENFKENAKPGDWGGEQKINYH
ncbi:C1 family peptidase [Paenibacillus sp. FSL W8-0186]|uniref:Peptidase C1A papain C-terminal domain-containing protein n=1 Tax=Paenibacillus woosongensis TaxID=307580 RepID=A0ABQ4MTU4_9BACL|nr:C1 family peptidase [Paenibacillus woosongensis]GIP59349.1 hypothetical protein J15TS10_31630 [Paenibacillus woosongensis]